MNSLIKLNEKHQDVVLSILRKNLLPHTIVWVFGSRANRTPKPFSDLDLAIDAGKPLDYSIMIDLKHDFDESELPYKVDIVDWHMLDKSFQERVDEDRACILLPT